MKIYFKHSPYCPISAGAKMEVDGFLKPKPEDIDYEFIDVVSDRPRSQEVATQLGVEHESPQVILEDGKGNVLWSASHRRVTKEAIIKAIETHP